MGGFPVSETFTSSYLHRNMQSAVPSTMSRGPASLCKQAQRAGKPLNLSSPIVCSLVDGWRGAPLRRAAVEALRLRTGPDVETLLYCMFEDKRGKEGPGRGAEGTAMQRLLQSSPVGRFVHDRRVWGTFHRQYSVMKLHVECFNAGF